MAWMAFGAGKSFAVYLYMIFDVWLLGLNSQCFFVDASDVFYISGSNTCIYLFHIFCLYLLDIF